MFLGFCLRLCVNTRAFQQFSYLLKGGQFVPRGDVILSDLICFCLLGENSRNFVCVCTHAHVLLPLSQFRAGGKDRISLSSKKARL